MGSRSPAPTTIAYLPRPERAGKRHLPISCGSWLCRACRHMAGRDNSDEVLVALAQVKTPAARKWKIFRRHVWIILPRPSPTAAGKILPR